MTAQLLIIKIQSLINGTSNFDSSQLRLLALEYNKLHKQCAKRLEQCISLIKTNRDYLALELAESDPALLDTINSISFAEIKQWNELCESNGIETSLPFDEYHIELLQSLYTKNIGQTHPLYRDYRRAMRMHNFRNALKIIGTISRINSNDFEIRQEYTRLLNAEIAHTFTKLKKALYNNDKEKALELYDFLEAHKNDFDQEENNWKILLGSIKEIKKTDAFKRKTEILKELQGIDELDPLCISYIEELNLIEDEYAFRFTKEESDLIATKQDKAENFKKERELKELKELTSAKIVSLLNAENRRVPAKRRLRVFKELMQEKDLIDTDTLKRLRKRISRLSRLIFFKRLTKATSFVCIVALCVYGYFYAKETIEVNDRLHIAAIQIAQLEANSSVLEIEKALDKYKKDYPDLLEKYELELSKVENKIDIQNNYAIQAEALIDKINALDENSLNTVALKATNADFASLDEILSNMLEGDFALYTMRIDECKKAYNLKLNTLRDEYESSLKEAFTNAENIVNTLNFDTTKESIEAMSKAGEALAEVESIISENSSLFRTSEGNNRKLVELKTKLSEEISKQNNFNNKKNLLANSHRLSDYFSALETMKFDMELPSNLRNNASTILDMKDEISYGSNIKNFTEEEIEGAKGNFNLLVLENLPANLLDISEIYIYENGPLKIYTQGALKEEKTSSWTGGYEIKQTGKEFSEAGKAKHILKNMIVQGNVISKDTTYKNGRITNEAVFVNNLQDEKHSLLKLINIVQNSDCDPIFKAWLESELFNLAKQDGAKSGFIYSYTAKEREKLIRRNAIGLNGLSWLKQNPTKRKELNYALYTERVMDLESEALGKLNFIRKLINLSDRVVGFVDENGELSIDVKDFSADKVYGISLHGREVLIIDNGNLLLTKAMPFSPLVIRD